MSLLSFQLSTAGTPRDKDSFLFFSKLLTINACITLTSRAALFNNATYLLCAGSSLNQVNTSSMPLKFHSILLPLCFSLLWAFLAPEQAQAEGRRIRSVTHNLDSGQSLILPDPDSSDRTVFGDDERPDLQIANLTELPFSAMGKLYVEFDGKSSSCTATMISRNVILTAAHCVYNKYYSGWAKSARFFPAYDHGESVFSSAYVQQMNLPAQYLRKSGTDGSTIPWKAIPFDFAVMVLDTPLGESTGWLNLKKLNSFTGKFVSIAGYPGDLENAEALFGSFGFILGSMSQYSNLILKHRIDTYKGQSGAALLAGKNKIVGVVSADDYSYNYAVGLDEARIKYIKKQIYNYLYWN